MQRRAAGQRNRRGRQAGTRVGVIRRVALQIRLANPALIRVAHAVNHRGVGLQAHPLRQAIAKHRRHIAPVVLVRRFLFHQARHNQQIIRLLIRQICLFGFPSLVQLALHRLIGSLKNLNIAAFRRNLVAIGEKQALGVGRHGIGVDFPQQRLIA